MYFLNPTGAAVDYMHDGVLGYIDTPLQGNRRPDGVTWCADNGCFNDKRFDESRWWRWLEKNSYAAQTCIFATAPDVIGDHQATLKRSEPWLPRIRALGYPAAFVAQDGATPDNIPWDEFDALFIGGTDEFKLGDAAKDLIYAANNHSKWVHIGRVNSRRRYLAFAYMSYNGKPACHSCDGTKIVFAPSQNLPMILSWVDDFNSQASLFGGAR